MSGIEGDPMEGALRRIYAAATVTNAVRDAADEIGVDPEVVVRAVTLWLEHMEANYRGIWRVEHALPELLGMVYDHENPTEVL